MKSPIGDYLDEVLQALRGDDGGTVATYIPQLATADPEMFGIAITTIDGRTYTAGDHDAEFSIQSISKPFAYAAAILDRGLDRVLESVGVEPSGEAFNELSLEGRTQRPKNPMINAGAITTHQLLVGPDVNEDARVERARSFFSLLAGRELTVNEAVWRSELETADRNLAITHMLKNYGIVEGGVQGIVDGYTRQCSIDVTVADLSVLAATLASGGVQPSSRRRVIEANVARQTMAVMAGAGMYDGAGDWLTRVGIPAKSGVSGGMVGVLPNQVGIAVFSPRLDEHGNSMRGARVFERLSRDMGMHLFAAEESRSDSVRLVERSQSSVTYELQGNVQFTAAEEFLHHLVSDDDETPVVVDVARVHRFTDVGRRMTLEGLRRLRLDGRIVQLRDPEGVLPDPDLGDGSYPMILDAD